MSKFPHGRPIHGFTIFQAGVLLGILTIGGGSRVTSSDEASEVVETKDGHLPREIHCPNAQDIFPCVCTLGLNQDMYMQCSNITSEKELKRVFSNDFPFTNFRELVIEQNSNIEILKKGDLGNASFTKIYFTNGVINTIANLALMNSWNTLTQLYLYGNELTSVPDISKFTQLSHLYLDANNLTQFPILQSTTLRYLSLGYNNIFEIPFNPFISLPRLQEFFYIGNSLTEIYPGTFMNNEHLEGLDLGINKLTTIPKDAIKLHGDHSWLNLRNNHITSLPPDAVYGLTNYLRLSNNNLTELQEDVYKPMLEKNIKIYLEDNPFNCGCDIAWLVEDRRLLNKLPYLNYDLFGPKCFNGKRFTELDPSYYKNKCNTPTDGF